MRILFLDQSGKLGGAELSLLDIADFYKDRCLVALFQSGPFQERLQQANIPVEVMGEDALSVQKSSNLLQALAGSIFPLLSLIRRILVVSDGYDIIYSNTQKAFVVGALVSAITRKPLVHHQRDILSSEHFSHSNLRLLVALANRFARLIIANSEATRTAFIEAGGKKECCQVVYNGFNPDQYETDSDAIAHLRESLGLSAEQFVVGHFSRLSPWKGQHVLIEAIAQTSSNVVVLLVGDALFGEDDYAQRLHQRVAQLGLQERVHFLGFRSDIPELMTLCDLVAHTSTAPEPFGRVIIESTLCGTPVVAAQAGGAVELITQGETGWLTQPGDPQPLVSVINDCLKAPEEAAIMARVAKQQSRKRFHLDITRQKIDQLIRHVMKS